MTSDANIVLVKDKHTSVALLKILYKKKEENGLPGPICVAQTTGSFFVQRPTTGFFPVKFSNHY